MQLMFTFSFKYALKGNVFKLIFYSINRKRPSDNTAMQGALIQERKSR